MTERFLPPWHLRGAWTSFLFRLPKDKRQSEFCRQPLFDRPEPVGVSALMLLDYTESTAGAYREIMFVPGYFKHAGRWRASITKIYVTSPESLENGRRNWAIPKELADIRREKDADGTERWTAFVSGRQILACRVKTWRLKFPITTAVFPSERHPGRHSASGADQIHRQRLGGVGQTDPVGDRSRLAARSQRRFPIFGVPHREFQDDLPRGDPPLSADLAKVGTVPDIRLLRLC